MFLTPVLSKAELVRISKTNIHPLTRRFFVYGASHVDFATLQSHRFYSGRRIDTLIQQSPLGDLVEDWSAFLASEVDAENRTAITRAERSGRPLGAANFIVGLEKMLGRSLQKQNPGPKPKGIK